MATCPPLSSLLDDVMRSMTQAIERLERATFVATTHAPPQPVAYSVAPPTAPPTTQAYQMHREPHLPASPYSDPYDRRHLDHTHCLEDPSRQDAPRHDNGHD